MVNLSNTLRPAIVSIVIMTGILGGLYPLSMYGINKIFFPHQISGSLITDSDGKILGSELIGQNFTDNKYLWGRLSATSYMSYNAAVSGASNLSPANPKLLENVKHRIDALTAADYENTDAIPVDLVTASASGLDPHISPAAAHYQVARIAKARGIDKETVHNIINQFTSPPQWGIFGEKTVHVLKVNLALDGKMVSQ